MDGSLKDGVPCAALLTKSGTLLPYIGKDEAAGIVSPRRNSQLNFLLKSQNALTSDFAACPLIRSFNSLIHRCTCSIFFSRTEALKLKGTFIGQHHLMTQFESDTEHLFSCSMPSEKSPRRPRQLSLRRQVDLQTERSTQRDAAEKPTERPKEKKSGSKVVPSSVKVDNSNDADNPPGENSQLDPKKNGSSKRPLMGGSYETKPERGVVYISHLPPGFLEPQLRKFFRQFGEITQLRLIRSKKVSCWNLIF